MEKQCWTQKYEHIMKKHELEKAVAILYDSQKSSSPKIIASGKGEVAKRIIETAKEAGVHIQEDANLVELLSKIGIGDEDRKSVV